LAKANELLVGAQSKTERTPGLIRKWLVTRSTRSKLHRNYRQGLDAKKNKTSLRRVKCFYLTSPFIEPAESNPAVEWFTVIIGFAVAR
jgi:hypothetical protein